MIREKRNRPLPPTRGLGSEQKLTSAHVRTASDAHWSLNTNYTVKRTRARCSVGLCHCQQRESWRQPTSGLVDERLASVEPSEPIVAARVLTSDDEMSDRVVHEWSSSKINETLPGDSDFFLLFFHYSINDYGKFNDYYCSL